jgi:hypothetical protein
MPSSQHVASLLVLSLLCFDSAFAQQASSQKASGKTATVSQQLAALTKQAEQYQALLQDPDVSSSPELSAAVREKWIDVACRAKQLNLSLLGIQDAALSKQLYDSCTLRLRSSQSGKVNAPPATTSGATASSQTPPPFPTGLQPPPSCLAFPAIKFDESAPTTNDPIPMGASRINLAKLVPLNATGSGGEIYTKAGVYVAYVNRLRYTASLGGTVSAISAPTVPFSQMFTTTPLAATQNSTPKPTVQKKPGEKVPQDNFDEFSQCYQHIWETLTAFQGKLAMEEALLNNTKLKISASTANLQPIVKTPAEARTAANLGIFPTHESPAFPSSDLGNLKILNEEFIVQYAKVHDWVTASGSDYNTAEFARVSSGANDLSNRLDQYLAETPGSGNAGAASNPANNAPAAKKLAGSGNPDSPTNPNNPPPPTNPANSNNPSKSTDNASEASDYEAARTYIYNWKQVFRTVNGANDDYFIETFNPQCGGFFGDGTSTQMQLSIVDNLNPPAAGTKVTPTNLDKVVCQSTISISNGLGLSFIPSQTPAFVPAVKKDSQGNPVLDSSGNPTIIQSLGYSNQSRVGAGYAFQANASLWATQRWGFEIHWSLGAMLTASSNGATTDIITGPSFSFRRRTFFVSPMYDLGLRTVYVSPFQPGMPQGNLTSPPTQQVWKSGFGLTITFPFNNGTKNVDSASGGANVTAPATNNVTGNTSNAPPKKNP